MNLRNNATNVRINEPYFIFGLTNLQVYKICVFGITNLRNNEPHPASLHAADSLITNVSL